MVYLMPSINHVQINNLAKIFHNISIEPMDLYNPIYYPEDNEPLDRVLAYFIVMVAMDHRLSRYGRIYQAEIDGRVYRGADLLYRLGKTMYVKHPEFFEPRNLVKISALDIVKWLSIGGASPPDPETRAFLLRDIGEKIIKIFDGDPINIIRYSSGYLRKDDGYGFIDILKIFRAYQDPVEKKPFLLAKFLSYRGILKIFDQLNKRMPIDNHLTRIAIRLGLIDLEDIYRERILRNEEFGYDEDILIRMSVREAYRYLCNTGGIDPFHLDDFLWQFGRTICIRDRPLCSKCLFRELCSAYGEKMFLNEHRYENTWYY